VTTDTNNKWRNYHPSWPSPDWMAILSFLTPQWGGTNCRWLTGLAANHAGSFSSHSDWESCPLLELHGRNHISRCLFLSVFVFLLSPASKTMCDCVPCAMLVLASSFLSSWAVCLCPFSWSLFFLYLISTTPDKPSSARPYPAISWDGVSLTFCLGWPETLSLQISVSQVTRITDGNHWHPAPRIFSINHGRLLRILWRGL
jgi:hypothetical protein